MQIHPIHRATCHCGAVELELTLPNGLEDPLRLYQFNTKTARHYFCSHCGIYTHHQRRSNPAQYGFNVACLEGVNPFELADVPTHDGVNHPADRQGPTGDAA
jgi:hypothetical protein